MTPRMKALSSGDDQCLLLPSLSPGQSGWQLRKEAACLFSLAGGDPWDGGSHGPEPRESAKTALKQGLGRSLS